MRPCILPNTLPRTLLLASAALTMLPSATWADNVGPLQTIFIQELQSPPGPRHSDGIINAPAGADKNIGDAIGLIWFSNDLAIPNTGGFNGGTPMGTQTGHCVEVSVGLELACYFRFNIDSCEGKGTITAEALFPLPDFPAADLTITGGTGDFVGIVGSGFTSAPPDFDGTTFFYTFEYQILVDGKKKARDAARRCREANK